MGLAIAERTAALVVSIDSMLVYRGMDIGTAKPTRDERQRVPHAMVDVAEPEDDYSVARFQHEAREAIAAWNGPVLLVGGSGLHMRAVLDPLRFPPTDPALRRELESVASPDLVAELVRLDPAAGDHVDLANSRRVVRAVEIARLTGETPSMRAAHPSRRAIERYEPELVFGAFGMDPGEDLIPRVEARVATMRRNGLLEEVSGLRHRLGPTAASAVGYRQLLGVIEGAISAEEGFAEVARATVSLAKRQRTFFRRDPRIVWLSDLPPHAVVDRVVGEMEMACAS